MLVMTDPEKVKARRNILLPLFRRAGLDDFHESLREFTAQFLEQVAKEQKENGNVDVFRWSRLAAFDIIGEVSYS